MLFESIYNSKSVPLRRAAYDLLKTLAREVGVTLNPNKVSKINMKYINNLRVKIGNHLSINIVVKDT